ncbi:hypothetical protein Tco_1436666, partial [Tanacetum coccineum]
AVDEASSPLALLSNPSIITIHCINHWIVNGSRWIKFHFTRIASVAIRDRDICVSSVRGSSVKSFHLLCSPLSNVALCLSELNESLEMTNLTLPSCRGPLELPFSPFNFHLPLVLTAW